MARKITLTLVALILFIPVFTYAADEPSGKPFQALQQQIDQLKIQLQNIQLTPGPKGDKGDKGDPGPAGHSPVLTWVGDQIAIDGVLGPHLTGPQGPTGATGATGPEGPPGVANGITTAIYGEMAADGSVISGANWAWRYQYYDTSTYTYVLNLNIMTDPTKKPTCLVEVYDDAATDPTDLHNWFRADVYYDGPCQTCNNMWQLRIQSARAHYVDDGYGSIVYSHREDWQRPYKFVCVQ